MKLEELQVYSLSMEMAEKIWPIVIEWDHYMKQKHGLQKHITGNLFLMMHLNHLIMK